jgi:cobalamin biosynthesis protein CobD/CbiB
MAGALNVHLGGVNVYAGVPHHSALLNAEGTDPTAAKARKALSLVALVSGLAFAAAFFVLSVRRRA